MPREHEEASRDWGIRVRWQKRRGLPLLTAQVGQGWKKDEEGDLSSCGDSPPYSRRKSAAEEPPETYYRGRQAVVTMTTYNDYPINQMMKDGSIMGTTEVMLIVETGGTTLWSGTIR